MLFIETGEQFDGRSRRVKMVPCCCIEPTSGTLMDVTRGICVTQNCFFPEVRSVRAGENLCECRLEREVSTFLRNILPPSSRSL